MRCGSRDGNSIIQRRQDSIIIILLYALRCYYYNENTVLLNPNETYWKPFYRPKRNKKEKPSHSKTDNWKFVPSALQTPVELTCTTSVCMYDSSSNHLSFSRPFLTITPFRTRVKRDVLFGWNPRGNRDSRQFPPMDYLLTGKSFACNAQRRGVVFMAFVLLLSPRQCQRHCRTLYHYCCTWWTDAKENPKWFSIYRRRQLVCTQTTYVDYVQHYVYIRARMQKYYIINDCERCDFIYIFVCAI